MLCFLMAFYVEMEDQYVTRCYTPTSYSAYNANNELFLIYSEGIKGELDLITKHVCHEAPNEAECQEQLPAFWGAIAVSLFNPENGWFAADNICMVLFISLKVK